MVTAKVGWEYMEVYHEEGPVLYAQEIKHVIRRNQRWFILVDFHIG